jgi:hypothetical protein
MAYIVNFDYLSECSKHLIAPLYRNRFLLFLNMNDIITAEIEQLDTYKALIADALEQFATLYPNRLSDSDNAKITEMLNRMFAHEKEFLIENPNDYFEIYCK